MDFESIGRMPISGFDCLLEPTTVKGNNTGGFNCGFSLSDFLSRYLVGNGALRESRHISRKRLSLANIVPAASDAETLGLLWQVRQYGQAKGLLAKKDRFSLADLCQANRMLTPGHSDAGKIRRKQNYVGGKTPESAFYVPPLPRAVSALMTELL
ncbi:hypothetical protein [Microbulbifer litoralis]|uniref:hypothetical protein n=1 Tax=Microbulbifer litoralis TaxID=2933965 RepID=UPI002029400F|nr:hypothetical protein [Microbulbifer sp. GX H0434]